MPVYTLPYPLAVPDINVTLPNQIRAGNPNPFLEPVLPDSSVFIKQEKSLGIPSTLPDGKGSNYKRPYSKDIFAASTTSGYTQMKQYTFTRKTGMITGYQIGIPKI